MQHFKILITSVTGVTGKLLKEGEIHPETEFTENHCEALVEMGAIEVAGTDTSTEDTTLPGAVKITKKFLEAHPELKEQGYAVGDTYPKPVEAE